MDRYERAETAIKVAGLALLARWSLSLVSDIIFTGALAQQNSMDAFRAALQYLPPALATLLGVSLLVWARGLADWMVPAGPAPEGEGSPTVEAFRLGMISLGCYFLLEPMRSLANAAMAFLLMVKTGGSLDNALRIVREQQPFMGAILGVSAWVLAGAALLGGARLLKGWVAGQTPPGWTTAGTLGVGCALAAFLEVGRGAADLAYNLAWAFLSASGPHRTPAQLDTHLVRRAFNGGLRLCCGLVLLALCWRAGRRLARGAPAGTRRVLTALEGKSWLAAALPAVLLWAALCSMTAQPSPLRLPRPGAFTTAAQWAAAIAISLAVVALMAAAGRWVPGLLREPGELHAGPSDRGALLVTVEVSVTMVALLPLLSFTWYFSGNFAAWLAPLLTAALALALRGDIARCCVRPGGAAADLGSAGGLPSTPGSACWAS